MANSSEAAILDLGTSPEPLLVGGDMGFDNVASQLQFQDFPRNNPTTNPPPTPSFVSASHIMGDDPAGDDEGDESSLLKNQKPTNSAAIWELAYFANYFDVTTNDVLTRIMWSVLPLPSRSSPGAPLKTNYIEKHIQSNPDLYGPLWVNVTLIFAIAICGNISSYMSSVEGNDWHYDFNKVGLAASTITLYTLVVPTLLWFFFWFRGCTQSYTLLETICAYGYSLSVYIPISIIWMSGVRLVQYVLVIVGALLSGSVLVGSFAPVVKSDPSQTVKLSYLLLLLIIGMHSFVAFTFLRYFF